MSEVNIQTVQGHQVVGHLTLVTVNDHAQRDPHPHSHNSTERPSHTLTVLQREVQALINQVPQGWLPALHDVMVRQWGGIGVDGLRPPQLHHLRWYVQTMLGRGGR